MRLAPSPTPRKTRWKMKAIRWWAPCYRNGKMIKWGDKTNINITLYKTKKAARALPPDRASPVFVIPAEDVELIRIAIFKAVPYTNYEGHWLHKCLECGHGHSTDKEAIEHDDACEIGQALAATGQEVRK